jgi:hypothetical protein
MIAFVCDYTREYVYHFIVLDAFGIFSVILSMLRPRLDQYGSLVTETGPKRQLFLKSLGNRFQVLSCMPFDWIFFFYGLVSSGNIEQCSNSYYLYSNGKLSATRLNPLPEAITLVGTRHNYLPGYGLCLTLWFGASLRSSDPRAIIACLNFRT